MEEEEGGSMEQDNQEELTGGKDYDKTKSYPALRALVERRYVDVGKGRGL